MLKRSSLFAHVKRFILLLILVALTSIVQAQGTPNPNTVTIAGTLQSKFGCSGDWQPDCATTHLTYSADDDLWQGSFDLPAGDYEYKAALDDSWDENYGANAAANGANIQLSLPQAGTVHFFYDHKTHWVTDDRNSIIANVPGDFQSEIGCPGDWQPDCLRSWLQDPDGDGIYVFTTSAIPAGAYQAKVAINQSWSLNYGDNAVQDGPNINFVVPSDGAPMTFTYDSTSHKLSIGTGSQDATALVGNLFTAKAQWVSRDTLAWKIHRVPGATYALWYAPDGSMTVGANGIESGQSIPLTYDPNGLSDAIIARFPQLADYVAFKIGPDDLAKAPEILKGQIAISASDNQGNMLDATAVQIPGVLDDLYTYHGDLGVIYDGDTPTLKLWAPTALSVTLHLYDDSNPDTVGTTLPMTGDPQTGVWSVTGTADWTSKYYLYEVEVYVPSTHQVEHNLVSDPYSVSLSTNSLRSQIADLSSPALMPPGWNESTQTGLAAPNDIAVYELHVRDFSIDDASVPADERGTFRAFTEMNSNGMQHLRALANAGLTYVHLMPAFDIASVNEDKSQRQSPDPEALRTFAPDSQEQQAAVSADASTDGYNWGYDPLHYTVPEGSYSTNPDGTTRIVEFREMVQALHSIGLHVVMDVVYNHTSAAGQDANSVLDKIVPGYYYRLDEDGRIATSTCCPDTASEHNMMEKLMIDSVVTWATAYKVDGFRFDLMGHHMVSNMVNVRDALKFTGNPATYLYGEGWNFGEVADNARGVNATQTNLAGTGIGTFNDRLRDAARGGSPFATPTVQGFLTGLYYDPNSSDQGTADDQKTALFQQTDWIRIGLAGNLRNYPLVNAAGDEVTGADIDYHGDPAGYTASPQENVVYVSSHDNQTLFDAIQLKAADDATLADRVRMQNQGNDLVLLSQGVPFFQAGDDMLRSKSGDTNSYNSGDWFNGLDFTYQSNNWGIGLPGADNNQAMWTLLQPLLANTALRPSHDDITGAATHFQQMLQIRESSPLFHLQTAQEVIDRLKFYNVGPDQIPGLIVMSLSDMTGADLDPNVAMIVVIFNATAEPQTFSDPAFAGISFTLHPVQANSSDLVVRSSTFEGGAFIVPARTTAVFVAANGAR